MKTVTKIALWMLGAMLAGCGAADPADDDEDVGVHAEAVTDQALSATACNAGAFSNLPGAQIKANFWTKYDGLGHVVASGSVVGNYQIGEFRSGSYTIAYSQKLQLGAGHYLGCDNTTHIFNNCTPQTCLYDGAPPGDPGGNLSISFHTYGTVIPGGVPSSVSNSCPVHPGLVAGEYNGNLANHQMNDSLGIERFASGGYGTKKHVVIMPDGALRVLGLRQTVVDNAGDAIATTIVPRTVWCWQ